MPGSLRRGIRRAALALTLVVAVAPARAADEPLTLERLYGMPPLTKLLPGYTWVGDSKGISHTKKLPGEGGAMRSALVIREVPSGKEKVIRYMDEVPVPEDLATESRKEFAVGSHTWNAAGTQATFVFGGDVFLIDRKGQVERCTDTDVAEKDPVFSHDGSWLAYSRGNDLYTYNIADDLEVRHTTTGCDTVYNGVLNWVYMEELFTRGDVRAYWWSPTANRLAFLEIRDGVVPQYPIVDQVASPAKLTMQRYPRPGDPNPVVRVGLVDATGGAITWVDADTRDDSYIARVNWLGDGSAVAVEKLNRAQDRLSLFFADAGGGRADLVMEESSPAWINVSDVKHFYKERRQFLWGSERDGYLHLHLFNLDGTPIAQVTRGEWVVQDLDGVDEKKKRIYFTANEGNPIEQHLFRIDENGKGMKRLTAAEGTHTITMSPDCRWYIDSHTSQTQPARATVHNADGKLLFELGSAATDEFAALRLPAAEYFTIGHEGRTYHCRMMKPLDFDPAKKYPVIVYTYGGPHAQVVTNAWSRHDYFHAYMAQRGYLVFTLDNRGSSGRGKAWEEAIAKRLGEVELADQVAGVNYLKSLPYVDGDRIGIWGWSYGGYMTLMAMFTAPGVFKAGAAVAPVADWRLYDSIYTERYMKLPAENAAGYDASAPLTHADSLRGGLLVLHGDADDNVHVQNAMALARKLIDAGKDFDLMLFPQKEHSIHGPADRLFLYRKMAAFFDRELRGATAAPSLTP